MNFFHFRRTTVISLFALTTLLTSTFPAFAGGSSMSWDVTGGDITAHPGEVVPSLLQFNLENYFPDARDVRLDSFKVTCYGGSIFSSLELYDNGKLVTSKGVRPNATLTTVPFTPHNIVLNGQKLSLTIGATLKPNATPKKLASCGISHVVISDPSPSAQSGGEKNYLLYNNAPGHESLPGYTVVSNESATLEVIANSSTPVNFTYMSLVKFFSDYYETYYLGKGVVYGTFMGVNSQSGAYSNFRVSKFVSGFDRIQSLLHKQSSSIFYIEPSKFNESSLVPGKQYMLRVDHFRLNKSHPGTFINYRTGTMQIVESIK